MSRLLCAVNRWWCGVNLGHYWKRVRYAPEDPGFLECAKCGKAKL